MTIRCLQGMLTIETFFDGINNPYLVLDQAVIKDLNLQIAKELQSILPNLEHSTYAIVGGLYQSSELLQPGFPIHTQLRQYANAALKGENNRKNQLIIGVDQGKLPSGLALNPDVVKTPLLLLPFVILSADEDIKNTFEKELMHQGMASKELLLQLQNALVVKIRHVNFMTMLDLAAMMHNHLQMAGFESLWQLLEQAIFNRNPETKVTTPQFNEFYLSKKIVFTPFFSFVFWGKHGPGKDLDNKKESYLHYTQVQRQYVATLTEHGLDVRQFAPTPATWPLSEEHICFATLDESSLSGAYYHEIINPLDETHDHKVAKNNHQHLGMLYYQVTDDSQGLEFYYPLTNDGIIAIEKQLKGSAAEPGRSFK